MTDEQSGISLSIDMIRDYTSNKHIIDLVKKDFVRMKRSEIMKLIELILRNVPEINIKEIKKNTKTFKQYNMGKIDSSTNTIKKEVVEGLRHKINGVLAEIGKEIVQYDEQRHTGIKIEKIDGEEVYILEKTVEYEKVRKLVCDEGGEVLFKYDFENPDLECTPIKSMLSLQREQIHILTVPVKFDYPVIYKYSCQKCGHKEALKAYEVISTRTKYMCEGVVMSADGKTKTCNSALYPDTSTSDTKDAFYYQVSYDDEDGQKQVIDAISFKKYDPGFYDSVFFKIGSPMSIGTLHLMDVKELETEDFELPKPSPDMNYVYLLQHTLDKFIERRTNLKIYGLLPIKVALIIQLMFSYLDKRIANIQIVGDASTGKSTVLKYYGILLNSHLHYSSNGQSISVPALRGTRTTIHLMGKEQKIITIGFLGTFDVIHVDEAGDNKELIQQCKTFLLESNYAYDKAGATGTTYKRTAQMNISQNLDWSHLGQYNGMIRKAYKESQAIIEGHDKPQWDENWDLHLPIFEYTNPYLMKIIKDKRLEYQKKQMWWVDGYEFALHERFPFYFYLVAEKEDQALKEIIKLNASRKIIEENVELIRVLRNKTLPQFMESLRPFMDSKTDQENFQKVDIILDQYGIHTDARTSHFYYTLLKASRILNKRKHCSEQDFDLIRWFIEKLNTKLDISNTIDYSIKGAPDVKNAKKLMDDIEDKYKEEESQSLFNTSISDDFDEK